MKRGAHAIDLERRTGFDPVATAPGSDTEQYAQRQCIRLHLQLVVARDTFDLLLDGLSRFRDVELFGILSHNFFCHRFEIESALRRMLSNVRLNSGCANSRD